MVDWLSPQQLGATLANLHQLASHAFADAATANALQALPQGLFYRTGQRFAGFLLKSLCQLMGLWIFQVQGHLSSMV